MDTEEAKKETEAAANLQAEQEAAGGYGTNYPEQRAARTGGL